MRVHADFTLLRAEYNAAQADDIANVHFLEGGVGLVPQFVAAQIDLQIALRVQNMGKAGLAHHPFGYHAACNANLLALQFLKMGKDEGAFVRLVKMGKDIGAFSRLCQLAQLFAANLFLLA